MIDMLAPEHEPGSRVEARERPEVTNEMSLIEITAGRSDVGPLDMTGTELSVLQRLQHLLKPPDSTEQLWCQPNFLVKELNESSWAETDLFG